MSYLSELLGDAYREGMTEDEISSALESIKSEPSDISHYKQQLSKANGEASKYKKQLREKMTEEEISKAEHDALIEENKQLTRQIDISAKTAKLLGLGYDSELASATAIAMVDNDFETVIANQGKFLDIQKQSVLQEHLKSTPRPVGNGEDGAIDYAKKIESAKANGSMAEVAYWTRLESESKQQE